MLDDASVDRLLALRSKKNFHLVARVAGHMLGSIIAVPLDGRNASIVQVLALVVDPAQHRRGIGRSLLRALVQEARREHHRYVIAQGPEAFYLANEWETMDEAVAGSVGIQMGNYHHEALPLERWMSRRTRWIDPTPLLRIPDPEGIRRLDLALR